MNETTQALTEGPTKHEATQVNVSRSRPSFPCRCGSTVGPNDGKQIFRANVKRTGREFFTERPTHSGENVYFFTCPKCSTGFVVETPERLTVAVPPVGEARNSPCPCDSGKKAKKCHPAGFVQVD